MVKGWTLFGYPIPIRLIPVTSGLLRQSRFAIPETFLRLFTDHNPESNPFHMGPDHNLLDVYHHSGNCVPVNIDQLPGIGPRLVVDGRSPWGSMCRTNVACRFNRLYSHRSMVCDQEGHNMHWVHIVHSNVEWPRLRHVHYTTCRNHRFSSLGNASCKTPITM